jgi:putative oxidoreductase
MKKILVLIYQTLNILTRIMGWISPIVLLTIRVYLFNVFFKSGWLKLMSWEDTLALFTNQFKVWLLSPQAAATIGTAAELILPSFLLIGLGGRFPAIALFIFNIVCVISFPFLLEPAHVCMLKDHILWGVLIAWLMFQGHGKLSLDFLLQYKFCKDYKY